MSSLIYYLVTAVAVFAAFLIGRSIRPATAKPSPPSLPLPFRTNGFWVILKDKGPSIILTIKAVRAAMELGLKEAKDLVDGAPAALTGGISKEEAARIASHFQGIAPVEIVMPDGWTTYTLEGNELRSARGGSLPAE